MTGVRLPDGFECTIAELKELGYDSTPKGAFWKDSNGEWAICTPNGRVGSIAKHTVVEHEDRTITVTPSILVHPSDACSLRRTRSARYVRRAGLAWLAEPRRLDRMLMDCAESR